MKEDIRSTNNPCGFAAAFDPKAFLSIFLIFSAAPLLAQTVYTSNTAISTNTSVQGFNITNSAVVTILSGGKLDSGFNNSYIGGNSTVGSGTLVVMDNGTLSGYREYAGFLSGSTGSAMVTGAKAAWTTDSIYLGSSGVGFLSLSSGAKITASSGYLGVNSQGTGTATISGAGSSWSNSSDLYLGSSGTGTLTVNTGGKVTNDNAYLGYFSSATGTVNISNTGSTWTSSSNAYVGSSGSGTLNITNGATASDTEGYLGYESGGTGTATVSGAGSTWTHTSFFNIGRTGSGTLAIGNGGTVSNTIARVGGNTSAALGTVTVAGSGSAWTNTGDLTLGDSGTGNLAISGGASVSNVNAVLANSSTGKSTTTLADAGSTWTNSAKLTVGKFGYATLAVSRGAKVTSVGGEVGGGAGGKTSTATITGDQSEWNLGSSRLDITGALVVTDGGKVTDGIGAIASGGSARVSGLSAQWSNTTLTNAGTLTVSNYATVVSFNGFTGGTYNIGDSAGGSTFGFLNVPSVTGGATLNFNQTDTAYFAVPVSGSSIVQRGTGRTLLSGTTTATTTATNGILQFGKRASFQNATTANWTATNLVVGSGAMAAFSVGGTGEFTAADLDLVKGLGTATGGFKSGSFLGIDTTNAPGGAFTYASQITNSNGGTNALGLAKLGTGSLTLTGGNTYTGGTILWDGTLIVNANNALGTGNVTVNGGTLQLASGVALPGKITLAGGNLSQQVPNGTNFATIANFDGTLSGGLPTVANMLAGTASAPAKIDAGFAAASTAKNDTLRQSAIFSLTGIPVLDAGNGATDTFVLQLAIANVTLDSYLAWLSPVTLTWLNAVDGNIGGTKFFAGNGAYDPATDFHLGTYGVDTVKGTVWAVLNHNSDFSVVAPVPEPSTIVLLGLGALAAFALSRRRA